MKNKKDVFFFILLTAGKSLRFKSESKLFYRISGEDHPIFIYPLKFALMSRLFFKVILVFSPTEEKRVRREIERCIKAQCLLGSNIEHIDFVRGGENRSASSFNALKHIRYNYTELNTVEMKDKTHVLIHDAARPYVDGNVLKNMRLVLSAGEKGVVPCLQTRDAIKQLNENSCLKTPSGDYRAVQTPQGYNLSRLYECYSKLDLFTSIHKDDASIYEQIYGYTVSIKGSIMMHKLTYREDINIIRPILIREAHNFSHFNTQA